MQLQIRLPKGHLNEVFHIFSYLKSHDRSAMVFDDMELDLECGFHTCDWSEYYPGAKEAIPLNAPEPHGCGITMTCYVDADHAGCCLIHQSQTGIIIFVQHAPIIWFSKCQNTVEASTFGSEFVAMRTAVDLVEALQYKLCMLGIPLDEPITIPCDNEAVVRNSTAPKSTLKRNTML